MAESYALVTGASSGIGFELAKILGREGYNLVVVARSLDKLDDLKRIVQKEYKVKVKILQKDLSKNENTREIYDEIKREKIQIDVLINNAGFGDYGEFHKSNWRKINEMINVNMAATTYLTKLFLPEMIERKNGYIMNLASVVSFQPVPLMAVYSASKSFVLSFTQSIANEIEGSGVSITALCPGATTSGFQKKSEMSESKVMNSKMATSEEVAEYGYKAMKKRKVVAVHGLKNKFFAFIVRFLPRRFVVNYARASVERSK